MDELWMMWTPTKTPDPLYESLPPQEICGLGCMDILSARTAKVTTVMRIGLTLDEYIELRLSLSEGADPAFQADPQ